MAAALILALVGAAAAAQEKLAGIYGSGPEVFTLATGSPGELGLLKALGEAFSQEEGGKTSLHWIRAGSGESLNLLKAKKWPDYGPRPPGGKAGLSQAGWATKKTLIGSNDFIVGPANDPAHQRGQERHDLWWTECRGPTSVLFKGDQAGNTYHALVQPPGATPGAATAARFVDFTASAQGQQIIRDYGREQHGEGLYNDAQYARQYDHH